MSRARPFSDDHDVRIITVLVNRAMPAFTEGVFEILSVIRLEAIGVRSDEFPGGAQPDRRKARTASTRR